MATKPISKMTPSERERLVNDAVGVIRGDYYTEVGEFAKQFIEHAEEQFDDGLRGEQLREAVDEHIWETLDGAARVIYTFKAQLGLLVSENDGAYEEVGGSSEGVITDGVINWSALMFYALREDVMAELDSEGFDVNDPESFFEEEDED